MNKITRKLLISVFTLGFALVTLGATTFAWFTLTSVATIDELDLEVIAGNYMEISIDGNDYKNRITSAEIEEVILESVEGVIPRMDAVTTEDGVNFVDRANEEAVGALSFKLWFRSSTPGSRVYLNTGTAISSEAKPWPSDQTFMYRTGEVKQNDVVQIYAADALRMSFQEFTNEHTTPKSNDAIIFELDSNNTQNIPLGNTLNSTHGLLDYWKKKMGEDLVLPADFTLPTVKGSSDLGATDDEPKVVIATLNDEKADGYSYGYIIVRLWIEGWDPDSFDAILHKALSVQFAFGLSEPETVTEP